MQVEFKRASFQPGDNGEVTILGASFLNIDRGREIILPGAYKKHVEAFNDKGRLLIDHKNSAYTLAGHVKESFETSRGLVVKGAFSGDDTGQWARRKIQDGTLKSASIGHYVHAEKIAREPEVKQLWAEHGYTPTDADLREIKKGPVRILMECEPVECSFVAVPMNDNARVLEVKSLMEIEKKKGATFNKVNRSSLVKVFSLVKDMLKSAKLEEEATQQEPVVISQEAKAVEQTEVKVVSTDQSDRLRKLRLELAMVDFQYSQLKTSGGHDCG